MLDPPCLPTDADWRRLVTRAGIGLALCAGVVVLCYFLVDRPFAYLVRDRGFAGQSVLVWLTYPPPFLERWAPLALVFLVLRRAWGPFTHTHRSLLAATTALLLAESFRESLKYLFGRAWPDTWIHDNPSLLHDGVYGFHFLHGSDVYGSFPSGHMARTLAVVLVVWIAWPRLRWLAVLAALAVAVGLLGNNYHFVSDVVAGAYVGGLVGICTAWFCGVGPRAKSS